MIYQYELAVLNFYHSLDSRITSMIYAPDEELLTSLDKVKRFPSLYYSRKNLEWSVNRPYNLPFNYDPLVDSQSVFPFEQEYVGSIIVEGQREAFELATKLKYKFQSAPYVFVKFPSLPELVRIALALTSVTIDDVRLPNDKLGSCRIVRWTWTSNLLVTPLEELPAPTNFVTEVRLGLMDYYDPTKLPESETVGEDPLPSPYSIRY